jgi:uncharacterized repeat protein (TIGR03803 family)
LSTRLSICLAAFAAVAPVAASYAATDTVLYSFTAPPNGVRPGAPVISDAAGNLYGTTYTGSKSGYGTVYELSPPAKGKTAWTERVLHHFGPLGKGALPVWASLTLDAAGNLYGVTPQGSKHNGGVVFELTKPTGGGHKWVETVLYHFDGLKRGGTPYGTLIFGSDGSLYGTTGFGGKIGAGTVFKLTPGNAGSSWSLTQLYNFTNGLDGGNPYCTLVFDKAGNLYGTTLDGGNTANGVVFELSPPKSGTNWTETVLHSFDSPTDGTSPLTGVIFDASGNLYGTTGTGGTTGHGTIFEVSPPTGGSTTWTEAVLYNFAFDTDGGYPGYSTLLQDSSGNLYGTTQVGGTPRNGVAFKLAPPAQGKTNWTETTLHSFTGTPDGAEPEAGFIAGPNGSLIGTTFMGGANNVGTVYELTP